MKIKMLTGLTGPEYSLAPGEVREFPDAEAQRLVKAGFAIPVMDDKRERAVKEPAAETRAKG